MQTNIAIEKKDNNVKKLIELYPNFWQLQRYEKGSILVQEGETILYNYLLKTGIVKAYVNNNFHSSHRETIINFFTEGNSIVMYRNDLPDIVNSSLTLEVIKDATIYKINRENWNELYKKEPILINEIFKQDIYFVFEKYIEIVKVYTLPNAEASLKKMIEIYPFLTELKEEDISNILGTTIKTISNIKPNKKNKK